MYKNSIFTEIALVICWNANVILVLKSYKCKHATLSVSLKEHCHALIFIFFNVACYNSALLFWNRMSKMRKVKKKKNKEISTKKKKILVKGLNVYQNGSFDFWTSCTKINCNPLPSLQSCTPSSKYLFYFVLENLFDKFIRLSVGIWQYSVKIRK